MCYPIQNNCIAMMPYSIDNKIKIYNDDVINLYESWAKPVVIISDGPYGIGGFPGDPNSHHDLASWYEPHIKKWTQKSTPLTTLWFWNTEIGWAMVHPILEKYGWEYRACNIWDKGLAHVAGNANTKSLRKLPIVSEVCVQYVKKPSFQVGANNLSMQEWLRYEWNRTGLPFSKTNEACGLKNAATRKYFTKCHLWYFPPTDAFGSLVDYANTHGNSAGKPYFSLDGVKSITKHEWERMRAKFFCPFGITNVWSEPPVNGNERIKNGFKAVHLNQKPLKLMKLITAISSEKDDIVWEPFGGLCSATLAAYELNRICYAAEINESVFQEAIKRFGNTNLSFDKILNQVSDFALVGTN